MHRVPPNDTSADSCLVLANRSLYTTSANIRGKKKLSGFFFTYFCSIIVCHKKIDFGYM